MKKNFIVLFSCIFAASIFGQMTPAQVLPHIMRGLNLGNTFDAPLEGQWNIDDPVEWARNGPAQEYYFDAYKEAGFQSIRIPVTWHTHVLDTVPYTIDTAWIKRVEEVVGWALERDMYVILNAHHDDWLKKHYSIVENQVRFDSIWSQIATYFKDKPESLLFEILNEPYGMTIGEVNELNARVLKIIRKTNPTRIVCFSGNGWANVENLVNADIPNDDYLIGYFHSYEPWTFAGLGRGVWGTQSDIDALAARIEKGKVWSDANNIPLVISEFGADTLCDYNSKTFFLAQYVEEASKRNIAFNAWDDGGTFQVYRRKTNKWHDTKDIFISYTEQSPNKIALINEDTAVRISWNNRVEQADSLQVERKISNSEFTAIATLVNGSSTYVDENLEPENYHYYRIKAFRNDSIFCSYPQRTLIVPPESEREPYYGTPFKIPGSFQAEDFDIGGYGLTYYDNDFLRPVDIYRSEKGVDIDTITESMLALVDNENGEWWEYSITVEKTATYKINCFAGSINGKGSISFATDGGISRICKITETGALSNTKAFSVVYEISEGEHILRMKVIIADDVIIDSISIEEYIEPITRITAIDKENKFIVGPNPVQSICTISSAGNQITNANITIYSTTGIKLYDVDNVTIPYQCNVEDFAPGLYILTIGNESILQTIELVRE